jgi:hypothetical protein
LGVAALWRSLPAPHRRWIVVNALFITALINLVLNALIAFLFTRGQPDVPFWARPLSETSLLGDTLGTIFILPLITGLLATAAVHADERRGAFEPISLTEPFDSWVKRLPAAGIRRGAAFGAIIFVFVAPPVAAILALIDPGTISCAHFIVYKGIFGIVLGALVTPVIALVAMTDPPPTAPAPDA